MTLRTWMISAASLLLMGFPLDARAQWSPAGELICTNPGPESAPVIISDGYGGALVAWQDQRSGTPGIFAQRLDRMGVTRWALNGIALCDSCAYVKDGYGGQRPADVASNGVGGAIVAWNDGVFDTPGRLRAQEFDGAGAPVWMAGGVTVQSNFTSGSVRIVADGAGGAIVAWLSSAPLMPVYLQKFDDTGAPLWPSGVIGGYAASYGGTDGVMSLLADGQGGVFVSCARTGQYPGRGSTVTVRHVLASGTQDPDWPVGGVEVGDGPAGGTPTQLAPDNSGGVFSSWGTDYPGTTTSSGELVQHVRSNGVIAWQPGGVSEGIAQYPWLTTPNGNNGVLHFGDDDQGNPWAQWVDSTGTRMWGPNGIQIINRYIAYGVASDMAGGALVLCGISAHSMLLAYRISPEGTIRWGPVQNGSYPVCAYGLYASATGDGAGGLMEAWGEYGATGSVYVQRIDSTGVAGVSPVVAVGEAPRPPSGLSMVFVARGTTQEIRYSLPMHAKTRLRVFDPAGRVVATLADGEAAAGAHHAVWDGRGVGSGVYFVDLQSGRQQALGKLLLLR